MLLNLVLGGVILVVCVSIQAAVVTMLLRGLLYLRDNREIRTSFVSSTMTLTVSILVMLAGNLAQMTIWASVFLGFREFSTYETAFYHSVVNFTSLGYGDIVMSSDRRLLGALEALNGILMLGLTTAFVYTVLHTLVTRKFGVSKETRFPGESEVDR